MIDNGSTIILRTRDAIYSPCKVLAISKENITVTYFAGMKKDHETGEFHEKRPVETIPSQKIVSIQERI